MEAFITAFGNNSAIFTLGPMLTNDVNDGDVIIVVDTDNKDIFVIY